MDHAVSNLQAELPARLAVVVEVVALASAGYLIFGPVARSTPAVPWELSASLLYIDLALVR